MTPVFQNAKDGIVQTFAAFFISAILEEAATLADFCQLNPLVQLSIL
jgi:hypothetical protein